jgi:hypothetical protein
MVCGPCPGEREMGMRMKGGRETEMRMGVKGRRERDREMV